MDENKSGHLEKYQGQLMPCQEKRCGNWPASRSSERNGYFRGNHYWRLQPY
jgi:hypothetical protein